MRSLGVWVCLVLVSPLFAQQPPAPVVVAEVEQRAVQLSQPLVATLESVTRSTVAAEQQGLIARRLFDEGQRVEKDQVLVEINTELLEIQRRQAEAQRQALAGMLAQARAQADNTARERQRLEPLKQNSVVTTKEYEDALTRDEVAQALVVTRAAELAAKAAEVQHLDLTIQKSQVKSPFGGVVSRRYVEVGQWIEQGKAVADVVQLDPLFVRVVVPESLIAQVKPGGEARVMIDALGEDRVARVDQILPEADAASRTFTVKLLLPNAEHELRPGFFARVTLSSPPGLSTFVVPKDAVVINGVASHVVAVREGKAVLVNVRRGATEGEMLAVAGELSPGELVVVRGNEALHDGQPVRILQPDQTRVP